MKINNKEYIVLSTPESLFSGIFVRLSNNTTLFLEPEEIREIVKSFGSNEFIIMTLDEYDNELEKASRGGYDECEEYMQDEIDKSGKEGYEEGFDECEKEMEVKIEVIKESILDKIDKLEKEKEDLLSEINYMKREIAFGDE